MTDRSKPRKIRKLEDGDYKPEDSIFQGVDLKIKANNSEHHTNEISLTELIVRRGQGFKVNLDLTEPFDQKYPLYLTAKTGTRPTEEQGTVSYFSFPDGVKRSPKAIAVWAVELDDASSPKDGKLILTICPPPETPIGDYKLTLKHRDDETSVALTVLFNAWCPDDWVYMRSEDAKKEYVLNEEGLIFVGSSYQIHSVDWDFGQFEDDMKAICLKILDRNRKHLADPGDDVSARCNPIYVGRVVSAMINCQDDSGVLVGRWESPYDDGKRPTHWSSSYPILKEWFDNDCQPVKYGQCWVFASVMCSVMRLLGIPCRVVTNFSSAHDTNQNLIIESYHNEYGVELKETNDSVWNFHVWTEAWMKRPDLGEDGKYDGWQVLDPTPQEKSAGVYCCGPAPVKAILLGEVGLKYDCPFVFAEVNADCVDFRRNADGTTEKVHSNHRRVGKQISTKAIGRKRRMVITKTYKPREGSKKERATFNYALTKDYSKAEGVSEEEEEEEEEEEVEEDEDFEEDDDGDVSEDIDEEDNDEEIVPNAGEAEEEEEEEEEEAEETDMDETSDSPPPEPAPLLMHFEEVLPLKNGKDVIRNLVLESKSSVARQLSINISVQAMKYNGTPVSNIQHQVKEKTLKPGKDLTLPVLVTFDDYHEHMIESDSMRVSAMITDKESKETYLDEEDIVLLDPPMKITLFNKPRLNRKVKGEVIFMNPTVHETLKDCTVTLSGSGLCHQEQEMKVRDVRPRRKVRAPFTFTPYKTGKKTILVDFDCTTFRDIKGSCVVHVKP